MKIENKCRKREEKIFSFFAICLCILQLCLLLFSWLITAAWPDAPLRSLLGSEGIRWFFGKLPDCIQHSGIVSLLMLCMAIGSLRKSGLAQGLRYWHHSDIRERTALRFVLGELIMVCVAIFFLTCIPHAILLSVSGTLLPSVYAESIVPTLSFVICTFSITYGLICNRLHNVSDCCRCIYYGISWLSSVIALYVLSAAVYHSVSFVFFH